VIINHHPLNKPPPCPPYFLGKKGLVVPLNSKDDAQKRSKRKPKDHHLQILDVSINFSILFLNLVDWVQVPS